MRLAPASFSIYGRLVGHIARAGYGFLRRGDVV
jgi:hypothetical protein